MRFIVAFHADREGKGRRKKRGGGKRTQLVLTGRFGWTLRSFMRRQARVATGGQTVLSHFAESSRHAGSSWTVHGQHGRSMPPAPCLFKNEIENVQLGFMAPGAVRAGPAQEAPNRVLDPFRALFHARRTVHASVPPGPAGLPPPPAPSARSSPWLSPLLSVLSAISVVQIPISSLSRPYRPVLGRLTDVLERSDDVLDRFQDVMERSQDGLGRS